MDDELEDKVLYQTYVSQMKLLSKFIVGVPPFGSTFSYLWKVVRYYLMKPEIVICGIFLFLFLCYIQVVEVWSRGILGRIQMTLGYVKTTRASKLQMQQTTAASQAEKQSWEIIMEESSVYALQGRRPKMEDRFVVEENVNKTGISLFAIFDGHGGEMAADFAKDILIENLLNKITETSNILTGKSSPVSNKSIENIKTIKNEDSDSEKDKEKDKEIKLSQRRSSFRKTYSMTEECINKANCSNPDQDLLILNKLTSIVRPMTRDGSSQESKKPQSYEAKTYIENGKINFGKMMTDEVLAADYKLVEQAKKTTNVAGTTALIAIMQGTKLIIANVGDSRGVMCDGKGNAIPLSFDHKPQQTRERKRIQEAGGFIAFKGVWRVAGILATSRALGDYPLKEKKLVIADPDILTFELADHKPKFLILASDGLWDTFSNEEAVSYIKTRLHEPHFGAKSITLQSYYRGSVDNISVLVIVFKNGKYQIGSSD